MKKQVLSVLILLIALGCLGQKNYVNNSLSLNVGLTYIARQDLIFSPLIHRDVSVLNLGMDYTRQANLFQKVSLRYGNFDPMVAKPYTFTVYGEPQNAYPHSFNLIDLSYLIGDKIKDAEKAIFYAGGLLTMDVQALNYVYGRISSFGYYSMSGLGVFGRYQYQINEKSQISTTLQLPIVGWQARSPYLVNDDEFIDNISSHSGIKTFIAMVGDGELVTWDRWQAFDMDIRYMYHINEKWQMGFVYLFEFVHSNQPRNLLSYRHSLNYSVKFNF